MLEGDIVLEKNKISIFFLNKNDILPHVIWSIMDGYGCSSVTLRSGFFLSPLC